MSDDPKFDELLRREVQGYRSTGEAPADAMWSLIERDVADAIERPRRLPRRWPWLAVGAAIAAALVIGIGVGRWTAEPAGGRDDAAQLAAHQRAAALDHLDETEIFLTEVRADLQAGRSDADRAQRSRELLARTRLLLRSPESQSPQVTRLLQDLELLLAEIAALPPDSTHRGSADAKLLEETLRREDIIPRIRTTLPSHRT